MDFFIKISKETIEKIEDFNKKINIQELLNDIKNNNKLFIINNLENIDKKINDINNLFELKKGGSK